MSVVLTHRDQQINSNHSPQNEISEMSKGILTPRSRTKAVKTTRPNTSVRLAWLESSLDLKCSGQWCYKNVLTPSWYG